MIESAQSRAHRNGPPGKDPSRLLQDFRRRLALLSREVEGLGGGSGDLEDDAAAGVEALVRGIAALRKRLAEAAVGSVPDQALRVDEIRRGWAGLRAMFEELAVTHSQRHRTDGKRSEPKPRR